jgi:hypothetical protein
MRTSRVRSVQQREPPSDQVEHLVEDALPRHRVCARSAFVQSEDRVLHLGLSWTRGRDIPIDLMSAGAGGHRRGIGDRRRPDGRIIVAPSDCNDELLRR